MRFILHKWYLIIFTMFISIALNNIYAKDNKSGYLFVLSATHGSLTYKFTSLSYQLTLENVDDWVTYFSVVPKYEGGFISTEKFTNIITHEIATHYPKGINAGLAMFKNGKKTATHYAFSLKNPHYDSKTHTMTYSVAIMSGVKPFTTIYFKKASLFVDDMSNAAGGAGF
ncbi:MAG: hypothetical protein JO149_09180 [Gammaproteobacteria bacterium]|nr:hypothetical protein [Gammaproteobacteria bacterium]